MKVIKLVYFFRGNLRLGSFTYKIERIFHALAPIFMSSSVLIIAFSLPIFLLNLEVRAL